VSPSVAALVNIKLNGPLVSGGEVYYDFRVSPDSSRVVYLADQDTDNVDELYSVPLTGGSPVKLNGPLVSGGAVMGGFQVSPDSSRVVYLADQDTDWVCELYSVPLAGGSPVKLNSPLVSGGDVFGCQVSPDSSRVVYRADQDTDEVDELYSVPLAGGSPVKLNGPLVSGGDVGALGTSFQISSNNRGVVYLADQDTDEVDELYVSYDEGESPPSSIYLPIIVKSYSP
jgi:Tol biopolymer transport system component